MKPPSRAQVIQENNDRRRAEAHLSEQVRTLTSQLQSTTSENQCLKHTVAEAHGRIKDLERDIGSRQHETFPECENNRDDAVYIWKKDTEKDFHKYEDIAGNAFIVTKDNVSASTISRTLGTDKTIVPCTKNHTFRVQVSNKGRAGASDVKSFLQTVQDKAPQQWKVQRERTQMTMQRERSLNTINKAIQETISTQPSLTGLKTHVGTNGSNIYLSYADRRNALDPKKTDAPAFKYPVWEHFQVDHLLNMGIGGLNYNNVTNLRNSTIGSLIYRSIPKCPPFCDGDVSMHNAVCDTGPRNPAA